MMVEMGGWEGESLCKILEVFPMIFLFWEEHRPRDAAACRVGWPELDGTDARVVSRGESAPTADSLPP